MKAYRSFSMLQTGQYEAIPGREAEMVQNAEKGYVFKLDDWQAFDRFLLLGSAEGTYYVAANKLTRENALRVIACINADGKRAVDKIVGISDAGRAPKNDPAIFALALAASATSPETRALALAALPKVCRIPTHLFHFVTYVRQFRGIGRGLRRALASWYNDQPVEALAYQVVKYQSRDGWSNRDVLRLAHPQTSEEIRSSLYKWITKGLVEGAPFEPPFPDIVAAFENVKCSGDIKWIVHNINFNNLSREMLPTESLKHPEVWEALLQKMPPHALLRNLGNLSKCGLLKPLSDASQLVVKKLSDSAALKKRRVHPVDVLVALKIYSQGKGMKGDGKWTPVPAVVDALNDAFYSCFDHVTPTGKRILYGVDMSGSMLGSAFGSGWNCPDIANTPLHPCEGAAAMTMASLRSESNTFVMGFANTFRDLGITSKMRLDDVVKKSLAHAFGRTDCAQPMIWALDNKINVDCFVVLTDNDTYAGSIHPTQALRRYREKTGINAKQVVVGMTSTGYTIADPKDLNALDCVGYDTSTPAAISEFIRGDQNA